jgi:hypothetical protein
VIGPTIAPIERRSAPPTSTTSICGEPISSWVTGIELVTTVSWLIPASRRARAVVVRPGPSSTALPGTTSPAACAAMASRSARTGSGDVPSGAAAGRLATGSVGGLDGAAGAPAGSGPTPPRVAASRPSATIERRSRRTVDSEISSASASSRNEA